MRSSKGARSLHRSEWRRSSAVRDPEPRARIGSPGTRPRILPDQARTDRPGLDVPKGPVPGLLLTPARFHSRDWEQNVPAIAAKALLATTRTPEAGWRTEVP